MRLALSGQPVPNRRDLPPQSLKAVFALGVVWGCYVPGAAPDTAPQREETVATRLAWIDAREVPREYLHVTTAPYIGPYYVLVSVSGHYCVVSPIVYASAQENQRLACDWRQRRPA